MPSKLRSPSVAAGKIRHTRRALAQSWPLWSVKITRESSSVMITVQALIYLVKSINDKVSIFYFITNDILL